MNPPITGCPYETWDGSYVLGSLSPAERREFEAHLDGCEHCSRAVRDLAGLPGLLGRIGPEVFDAPEPEPVPETLLPRLSRAVRRQQQRRTWLTAGIAAAAAVAVTTGGALALDRPSSTPSADSKPPVVQPSGRIMTQVARDPMTARVALTSVPWGTRLDVTCNYPPGAVIYEGGAYALVVHTKDGRSERVATWNGLPGKSMQVSGATSAWKKDISSVVVTKLDGSPVAELTL
ncbi:MAG TPA: zf-HC2 domain-containing protein [Nocardioides sp.]|uniref:anti-sigma factor family protein n=1 Tax=Nocardioides sp. TaxID=35761 RepID=UPI002F3FB47A